jgi:hypothetical protein
LYGRVASNTNPNNRNSNNSKKKGDIINVAKAVVRKSILMQITKLFLRLLVSILRFLYYRSSIVFDKAKNLNTLIFTKEKSDI